MARDGQTLRLRNDLAEIERLAQFVAAFCAPLQPTAQDESALQLALEEVVTNVINHGYTDGAEHHFTVELRAAAGGVAAVVTDDAPAFDPLARAPVDLEQPLEERAVGGLGVHLVRKLMDAVRYERREGRNVLTLERAFRRPA